MSALPEASSRRAEVHGSLCTCPSEAVVVKSSPRERKAKIHPKGAACFGGWIFLWNSAVTSFLGAS